MTDMPIETDVAIIGAGPAGLFAAFQCAMLLSPSVAPTHPFTQVTVMTQTLK